MVEKTLGGVAAIATLLLVGAVYGRVHGSEGGTVKALGDRVASGLFAIPLISVCVHLAFPNANLGWALAAPAPLAIYTVLLAGTDLGWGIARKYFVRTLLIAIGAIYAVMALVALSKAT